MTKTILKKLTGIATLLTVKNSEVEIKSDKKQKTLSYHDMYHNINKKFDKNITEETFYNIIVSNFGKNKFLNEEILATLFKKMHFEFKDIKQSDLNKLEINIINNLLTKKLKFKEYERTLINQMKLNITLRLLPQDEQEILRNKDEYIKQSFLHTFENEKTFNSFVKNYETSNDLEKKFNEKFIYVLNNLKIINDVIQNNKVVKHHHHEMHHN